MGVNRLPWTPAVKIWTFDLTQDHLDPEDTEGNQRSLCPFCSKSLQYGCLQTPLEHSIQDLEIWADSRPTGHWGHRGYAVVTPIILVSMDSPGPQQSRFGNLSWLRTNWTLRTPGYAEVTLPFLFPTRDIEPKCLKPQWSLFVWPLIIKAHKLWTKSVKNTMDIKQKV